ncbi:MAG: hypothetical protein CMJ54_11120 [Planctomycetaceae bacterium]|nr:hypothetical protein [Planctomycetaceae bacterium]
MRMSIASPRERALDSIRRKGFQLKPTTASNPASAGARSSRPPIGVGSRSGERRRTEALDRSSPA